MNNITKIDRFKLFNIKNNSFLNLKNKKFDEKITNPFYIMNSTYGLSLQIKNIILNNDNMKIAYIGDNSDWFFTNNQFLIESLIKRKQNDSYM